VVSAVASTEGAIAAAISVVAGERLTIAVAVVLIALVVGVAIVALSADDSVPAAAAHEPDAGKRQAQQRLAIVYAVIAAICFGLSIYGTAQLGKSVNPFAAVLPVRVAGALLVFVPMALGGRLKLVRPAVPMILLIGAAEVVGNASYAWGTTQSVAISAVLASQFAGVAAIAAFLIFRERLTVGQRSGVVAIAVGVAVLTLVR
jgi:drug/metabolite transporter (DMT)-like permease